MYHYKIVFPDKSFYELHRCTRLYTHAVIMIDKVRGAWMCGSVCGSAVLARKRIRYWQNCPAKADFENIQVIEIKPLPQ